MSTKTKGPVTMLRQVLLVRSDGIGQDVFWIANELAVAGKRVVDEDGVLWTVAETYNARAFEDVDRQIRTWSEFAKTLGGH